MCIVAGIAIAGSAVLGAVSSSNAARSQENAANRAQQTQQSMFDQTNANQAPFRQAGLAATNELGGIYGLPGYSPVNPSAKLAQLPGYQFQLGQGVQAIDRSAAANGLLNSGATGKALTQYGQGLAGNYFGSYVGGLQNLAGLGEGATQATSQAGANAANQISSAQIYSGNAAAQGDINTYGAFASGINQGIGLYGYSQGQMPNYRAMAQAQYNGPTMSGGGGYTYNTPGYVGTIGLP